MVIFSVFMQKKALYSTKNAENDHFNQCLRCAAPNGWLKYTTGGLQRLEENTSIILRESHAPTRRVLKNV